MNTPDPKHELTEAIEQLLNQSDGGDVRISYPDGHSEIKDAKVLLVEDITAAAEKYADKRVEAALSLELDDAAQLCRKLQDDPMKAHQAILALRRALTVEKEQS
jgi:hypothetical protein